ncbi:MAG: hemerythrin domain-containing protein [Thermoplasmata archaeon]
MTTRENLFRPIHKGIRSMLYELGSRLQATNFADVTETNAITTRLKHDLGNALSNCILCLLRTHSSHEEKDIFSALRPHDPDVVDVMMRQHAEVARRIHDVSKTCDEIMGLTSPARRIEVGDRLNLEVNDLFAYYLTHLNDEESIMVPVMWEWFTDEQLRAMRDKFYDSVPLPLFEVWMRWTLPSLNVNELLVLFSGLKQSPESARFKDWVRLAHETLDLPRLRALEDQVGLGAA